MPMDMGTSKSHDADDKKSNQRHDNDLGKAGHRKRMRGRILDKGAYSLTELELLEVLLYAGNARRDTKPLAKNLINKFRSLSGVLRADSQALNMVDDMGDAYIATIKLVEAVGMHLAHSRIKDQPILTNWVQVQEYCINRLAHQPIEHLVILCLDNQNRLIAEETLSKGTVDQTPVYVREVVNVALKHHAQSSILVHNHPSGEAEPSRADIDMTLAIQDALNIMSIKLHDHLIVAGKECVSLKNLGYL